MLGLLLLASPSLAARPVLIVPGFGGSWSKELFCQEANAVADVEGWLRRTDKIPRVNIGTVVPDDWTADPITHSYEGLERALREVPDFVVSVVPWDWRASLREQTVAVLLPAIQRNKPLADDGRVSIVAHSAGGLLVRDYIQNFSPSDIDRVAFLGTPHRGVVDAYLMWAGGDVTSSIVPWSQWGRLKKRLIDGLIERVFENIKEGCGCSTLKSDFAFVTQGCPKFGPLLGIKHLLPTFPYLKRLGKRRSLITISDMCVDNQNDFLLELEKTGDRLSSSGVPMKIFAGATLNWTVPRFPARGYAARC
jgi:hypothetical protein